MQGARGRGLWPVGLAVGIAASVVLLTAVQWASARVGTACDHDANTATFTFNDPGLKAHVSVSYNENFTTGDKVAATYKGTIMGTPTSGAGSCDDPDPFSFVSVKLGRRDDTARLDAKKPASLDSQAVDPLPASVGASIQGGHGNDVLRGHAGPDGLAGGAGADILRAAQGSTDEIDCGRGRHDKAILSKSETYLIVNCEKIVRR